MALSSSGLTRFWTVWLVAGACAAMFLASLYKTVMLTMPAPVQTETAAPSGAPPDRATQIRTILNANLFKGASDQDPVAPSTASPAGELRGTFVENGGQEAYAIITEPGGSEKTFRLGDAYGGGRIESIEAGRVVIGGAGGRRILQMKETP